MTVTGTHLTGATQVRFGAKKGTQITVAADGQSLSVVSPAHGASVVAVRVVTAAGKSKKVPADRFTYVKQVQTASLAVSLTGAGTGSVTSSPAGIDCGVTCSAQFPVGSVVTLTATPSEGSSFVGWSGVTGCASDPSCTVTIAAEGASVSAQFEANVTLEPLTLNFVGDLPGDQVLCDGTDCVDAYPLGSTVTLTAQPAAGNSFDGWAEACSGTDPCDVTFDAPQTVTATFSPIPVDYCNVVFPQGFTVAAGQSTPTIYGQIYQHGLTEQPGASAQIIAQVGFGPHQSDPSAPAWTWNTATYNVQVGNNDEYQGSFIAPDQAGTYSYAYRFSLDGGGAWTSCTPSGPYTPGATEADMTVTP